MRGNLSLSKSERCKSLILIYISIKCDSYGKTRKDYLSPLTIGEDQEEVRASGQSKVAQVSVDLDAPVTEGYS